MAFPTETEVIEWRDGKRVRVIYRDEPAQVDSNTTVTVKVPISVEIIPDDEQFRPGPKEVKHG